jgi:CubicO group peptidase (beta-lactamase class C family)
MTTSELVHGFADERFAAAREAFANNLATGADVGASFCATINGETVVDLWGGYADEAKIRPWEKDTIVNVYSTTKTMAALTVLLLADRGLIDFDAPVATYWPEFAANGKQDIKVSHLMSHASGLSGWREPFTGVDLYDAQRAASLLAAQAPLWEPGTASGYHVYSFGFLLGELVQRVTGKILGTVFREEIAGPLGADFWIGLPASEDHRVADLIQMPMPANVDVSKTPEIMKISLHNTQAGDAAMTRTREWRAAEIPAVNGHGNARSIAEIHTILANGGVARGKRFMSEAGCRRALEQQIEGPDLVMLSTGVRFGLGFGIAPCQILQVTPPNPNTIFWAGGGGSIILIDMDARTTMAFAMNKMQRGFIGDERSFSILREMWKALAQ